MLIKCLGGFREVGKNAILIETEKERILLDYGVKVETGEVPKPVARVDSILLSHAHLDHCGSTPILFKRFKSPIYSTVATFEQSHLLLKDSIKVAKRKGFPQRFSRNEIKKMRRREVRVTYGQQFETKSAVVDVYDAGHIPGSACFVIEVENKRILYTGDFNFKPTRLLNGAKIDVKDIDILIMESTYASKEHPIRRETEKKLFEIVSETIANDGIALIPSFAIARAAEIIMVLDSFKPDFPIYLDGMAIEATQIALRYPEFLRDPKVLRKAFKDVRFLHNNEERRKAVKNPCAIITTSGMLEGGPVIQHMKYLYNNPQSSVIFVGFLIPRTAGRYLLDTGRFVTENLDLKVKMRIYYLDFSAHSGRSDLFELVHKINPEKVICMHGDYCERFARELKGRGFDAIAPKNGDTVDVDRWF
jgi:putative mRNA 3-end processing factor